jgi:cell shape-determining protein MreD
MKVSAYFTLFLLIIPFQAGLINPLSIAGIKPDLALALLYIIGLLIGPLEAVLVGISMGLLVDSGSASLIGLMGFTRGFVGLFASLLGRKVLNISSPSNGIFLASFSLVEGISIALFLQFLYGDLSFFSLVAGRVIPQAIYTGVLGVVLLRFIANRNILTFLTRRTVQREF